MFRGSPRAPLCERRFCKPQDCHMWTDIVPNGSSRLPAATNHGGAETEAIGLEPLVKGAVAVTSRTELNRAELRQH